MNQLLAKTIVDCLRLSGEQCDLERLKKFKLRHWSETLRWLDDSGLALYFLQRLQSFGATDLLPADVLARLQQNLAENRQRTDHVACEFNLINTRFQQAGMNFAVIKGFSLAPTFCPDLALRTFSDLDYLVDRQSLLLGRQVLKEMGYSPVGCSDIEFKFGKPSPKMPTTSDSPYSIKTEPLVELHTAFWKRASCVPLREPEFLLERTVLHSWRGLRFPALNERDAFIFQVLHVFQHILEGWIKLGWLLEIGCFLSRRSSDAKFWCEVDDRIQRVPYFTEFAAIVIGLVKTVFAAATPDLAEGWMRTMRAHARLWLENYAETWVFDEHRFSRSNFFPTAKLALFLHQEYIPNPEMKKDMVRRRLFPWKRPERVAVPVDQSLASVLAAAQLQGRFVVDSIIFHSGSSLRYLWELPRWRELTS